jgi:predicted HAD superfamily hydrolase
MKFDLLYTSLDKLIKHCEKYDVISFDIFDTALTRVVDSPEKVFHIIGKTIGDNLFVSNRIRAQKIAEEKYGKTANLENIYQEMASHGYVKLMDKDKILKLELETESKVCVARVEIRGVIKRLSELGKVVVFLSDMYISGEALHSILRNKGFTGFQRVLVSCDIGKNKIDGDAYSYLKELYPSRSILHIGDNLRTDYINAKRKISSILVSRVSGDSIDKLLFSASSKGKSAYNWGYVIMSKIAYGFITWLDRELKNSCVNKVLFLTREGAFFKEVFSLLGYEKQYDSKLFYVSRLSMLSALAAIDFQIVSEYILKTKCSVGELCKIFGLEEYKTNIICEKYHTKIGDRVNNLTYFDLLINEIIKESKEYISEQYELLKSYIYELDLNGKVAIVDIGWNGTMQYLLEQLIRKITKDIELTGYYLGEFSTQGLEYGIIKYGYLCKAEDRESVTAVVNGAYVLEQCFTPNMGSVIEYKKEDNSVIPILKEHKQNKTVFEIQKGIIDAINLISMYQHITEINVNKESLLYAIKYPNKCYANILGDIKWSDVEEYRYIARPENIMRYVISPKRIIIDFQKSGWKSAFLRRLFKLPLPYYNFYRMMKGF